MKLSQLPLRQWTQIEGLFVFKDEHGFMLSVEPNEADPFKNGAFVANDEIEALVDFLTEDK